MRKDSYCFAVIYARQHAVHADRDIVMTNTSVCPSVCPSHAGIVSKRVHISSLFTQPVKFLSRATFFYSILRWSVAVSTMRRQSSRATAVTKFQGELPQLSVNDTAGWKNLRFSTESPLTSER